MEQQLAAIKENKNIRENLSELRKQVKEPGQQKRLRGLLEEERGLLPMLLRHEDPKVRKNAALLIGGLQAEELLLELYRAYEQEQTLFVRSAYLKAMQQLDASELLEELNQRLIKMRGLQVAEEEQKHYREEITLLQQLLSQYKIRKKHEFTGNGECLDVVLMTNRSHREVTAQQIPGGKVTLVPLGVQAQGVQIRKLLKIRTYQELLFRLKALTVEGDPKKAADMLASSGLWELLEKTHKRADAFYFRITILGGMSLEDRSDFIKKCSFELERHMRQRLLNDPSEYEVEIRLLEKRDGTFLPLVKLHTMKDRRFSYRKHSLPVSIKPSGAALVAALAKPYLKEGAQVLDPFCGVGTMLIERDYVCRARTMYGVDQFGEAIKKARENTDLAKKEIYYINRDFFDFTHEYLFDEIMTNMPTRGKRTKEEQELFYQRFFEKGKEVLRPGGIMVLHSDEKGYIRKQLRLQEGWKLLDEYDLGEKSGFGVYIISNGRVKP